MDKWLLGLVRRTMRLQDELDLDQRIYGVAFVSSKGKRLNPVKVMREQVEGIMEECVREVVPNPCQARFTPK